jgi:GTPase SAR1 family protein
MHFCSGLPIILVGCKKDLRREPRVIEELRKTSQRPVTPEEVCAHAPHFGIPANAILISRAWPLLRRLVPNTT